MKFVIVGAGGVGGYYGAMLARGGHEIFFIARGEHLKKIAGAGLEIKSVGGDFRIKAMAGETPALSAWPIMRLYASNRTTQPQHSTFTKAPSDVAP
ncbi:MAG TPA: hypothetical protein ENI77_05930 [Nitrospirae bacterium]|nr:hypothetical protein [Nitrospirota bacterium]